MNNSKLLRKPPWIRSQLPSKDKIAKVENLLRINELKTVCEEAACPNRGECFSCGTATFMIMGDICTRNCRFCNVKHGRPLPLDCDEPNKLAQAVNSMGLKYVVITSVTRDDLEDGGASHFAACIKEIRQQNSSIKIEVLTPDFRGCMEQALNIFKQAPPDVFNHNIETVPRLYKKVCPSADYKLSLNLLKEFKNRIPQIPTKSGMMLGLGETDLEIEQVLTDLRRHDVDRLTLGQYLQPTINHLPVDRYVTPQQFGKLAELAKQMGFKHVASGPMVRSSYHAASQ
jgi:lipoic acid synthetase